MANPNSKSAKTMTMFTGLNFNAEPTPAENSPVKNEAETPNEFQEAIQNTPGAKGGKGERVTFDSKRNEQVADVVKNLSSNKSASSNVNDNFKENYTKSVKTRLAKKKSAKKIQKIIYINEEMKIKIDDALESGRIYSFNDLVNTLLDMFFDAK